MNIYEIKERLEEIAKGLIDQYCKVRDMINSITHEIDLLENVELSLIPNKRRGKSASLHIQRSQDGVLPQHPVLYERMQECGYTLGDMKKLFGSNTHIMSKISFGRLRFTDKEAEKLTDLFQLTEEEREKYFWKGLIKTDAQGHKDYTWN